MGFTNDVLVSRMYRCVDIKSKYFGSFFDIFFARDNRLTSIAGGADEVMLQIICKGMGTLPKRKK